MTVTDSIPLKTVTSRPVTLLISTGLLLWGHQSQKQNDYHTNRLIVKGLFSQKNSQETF